MPYRLILNQGGSPATLMKMLETKYEGFQLCSVTRDLRPQPSAGADIPIQATVAGMPLTVKLVYTVNYGPQSIIAMTAGAAGASSYLACSTYFCCQ